MAKQGIFITGTDTDCGKTYFSVQLLQYFRSQSLSTVALKPVASGCALTEQGLRNQDALLLQQAATQTLPYSAVNPIAFGPPVTPNVASCSAGVPMNVSTIINACQPALATPADMLLVEGCGGWLCPINQQQTMADVAEALSLPVILVVGLKLGCLNHTLLTWQVLQHSKVNVMGWVANYLSDDMLVAEENIQTLIDFLGCQPLSILSRSGQFQFCEYFFL